jgi:tetratricopeptide (TPR) repeat protein
MLFLLAGAAAAGLYLWPGSGESPEERWFAEGEGALSEGRYEVAVDRFGKCVDRSPRNASLRLALGKALLASGRPEEGRAEIERARELDPSRTEPLALLGRCAAEAGRIEEAVEMLREAARRTATADALIDLGRIEIERGRVTDGLGWLEKGCEGAGRGAPPLGAALRAMELYGERDRVLGDRESGARARELADRVVAWSERFGGERSWEAATARALLVQGNVEAAEALANEIARRSSGRDLADALMVQARATGALKLPRENVADFLGRAIAADDRPVRHREAARIWEELGSPERALSTLESAVVAFPGDLGLVTARAEAMARRGHAGEAAELLHGREQEFGEEPDFALCLAETLRRAGDLDRALGVLESIESSAAGPATLERRIAVEKLERALLAGPGAKEAREVLRSVPRPPVDPEGDPWAIAAEGLFLALERRHEPARELLEALWRQDPLEPRWRLLLGRARFLAGAYEDAVKHLTEVFDRTEAEWPAYRRTLVLACYRRGLYRAAIAAAERLAGGRPDDEDSRWLQARVLLAAGETEKAAAAFEMLVGAHPGNARTRLSLAFARALLGDGEDPNAAQLRSRETVASEEEARQVDAAGTLLRRLRADAARGGVGAGPRTRIAEFFYALGHREEAVAIYRREIALHPRDALARRRLCEACLDEGRDLTPVLDQIGFLEAREPDNPLLGYLRGRTEVLAGDPARGVVILERFVAARPKDRGGRLALGEARWAAGDAKGAAAELLAAWRLDPWDPRARRAMGRAVASAAELCYEAGDDAGLRSLLEDVAGFTPPPGNGLSLSRLLMEAARCASGDGRPAGVSGDLAGRRLARLIALIRGLRPRAAEPGAPGEGGLDRHLGALEALASGAPEESLLILDRGGAGAPDVLLTADVRIAALGIAGRADDAVAFAQSLVETRPREALCHVLSGHARLGAGDAEGARGAFERALDLSPGLVFALHPLAELTLVESGAEAAARWVRSLARERPDEAGIHFLAGWVLSRCGRAGEATGYLGRAAERAPGHRDALLLLARCCREAGLREEAGEALARAHARDPGDEDVLLLLAEHEEGRGNREGSVRRLRECLLRRPDSEIARASLCERLEEQEEARFLLLRGLRADPESPILLRALARLVRADGQDAVARDCLRRAEQGLRARLTAPDGEGVDLVPGRVPHRLADLGAADLAERLRVIREELHALGSTEEGD